MVYQRNVEDPTNENNSFLFLKNIILQNQKISDPFHPTDFRRFFSEFFQHVDQLQPKNVDLKEMGRLLRGAGKIYASQIAWSKKDVDELGALCSRTKKKKAPPVRGKKSKKRVDLLDQQTQTDEDEDQAASKKKANVPDQLCNETVDNNADSGRRETETENCPAVQVSNEIGNSELSDKDKSVEVGTLDNEVPAEAVEVPLPLATQPVGEIGGDGEGPESSTRRRSHDLDETETPVTKKRKKHVILPPTLIDCHEEWNELLLSGALQDRQHAQPPLLGKGFRLLKRNVYAKENNPLGKNEFILGHESPAAASAPIGTNSSSVTEPQDLEVQMDSSVVDIEPEISNGFSISQELLSPAAAFPVEDQALIQKCFSDLHLIFLNSELSPNEISSAFSRIVNRISQVFKKNNVALAVDMHRVIKATHSSQIKEPNDLTPHRTHSLGDVCKSLVQACRQDSDSFFSSQFATPSEFSGNPANFQSVMVEMRRRIVNKFAPIPLMAENTPEFFQCVAKFDKKMKRVLEEDKQKGSFDVRKYEKTVLDITRKEFLLNSSGDRTFTSSVASSFEGSQSNCASGTNWVPLKHIFQEMKSVDRAEISRSFCAVLQLLSYQNLDINYDQLYCVDSESLSISKEDELGSRFPTGIKIVTSRCPDVDKDEVSVMPLLEYCPEFRRDEGIAEDLREFVVGRNTKFSGKLQAKRRNKKIKS